MPAALADRLEDRGWRITPQRRAVIRALEGEHVHLSADQVHAAARRVVPEVSLATVYNTLNELIAMGEIASFAWPTAPPVTTPRSVRTTTTYCANGAG